MGVNKDIIANQNHLGKDLVLNMAKQDSNRNEFTHNNALDIFYSGNKITDAN